MKRNQSAFHRSVIIVTLVHLGLIGCIIFLVKPVKKVGSQVTWLEAGSFAAPASTGEETSSSQEEEPVNEKDQLPTKNSKPKEEIAPEPLPVVTPEPTPEVVATPSPTANSEIPVTPPPPKTTPIAKVIPKATPKPTPRATPKPSPKPKPQVKKKEREEKPASSPKSKAKSVSSHKTSTPTTSTKKSDKTSSAQSSLKKGAADHEQEGLKKAFLGSKNGIGNRSEAAGNGSGTRGNGVDASALAGYHELIHDRFYSQWEQPTAIPTEHKHDFVCTLRLTIERDGTISNFSLAKPSGNPVMDESVLAAAAKVKQIAPLPEGLHQNSSYTVNINFELE